jgi:putative sterol carrier protein
MKKEYEFHIDNETFHILINNKKIKSLSGKASDPIMTLYTNKNTFLELISHELSTKEAILNGKCKIEGDSSTLDYCIQLFNQSQY